MGNPHTDTGYDAGASIALAMIGLLFFVFIFASPWLFEPSLWDSSGTYRIVTVVPPPSQKADTKPPPAYSTVATPSLAKLSNPPRSSGVVNV